MQGFRSLIVACVGVPLLVAALCACDKEKPRFVCQDSLGCVNVAPGEPLKIGVLQALSGKVAPLGQDQIRGIELAVSRREGRILDHAIMMQMEDTGCTAEGGANAALKVIADPQTVAILGTTCSSSAATASKAMSDAGLTMISGNNSAPFLTAIAGRRAPNWQSGYFRTAPNEETSGKAAAMYAFQSLGIHDAATINDGDIYTTGLTDGFKEAFEKLGGKIVLSACVNKGEKEMRPVLEAVIHSGAQIVFFPLFQPEGNHLLLEARNTPGFENIVLMSDGALIESSFLEAVQDKARGMYFVGPSHPSGPAVDALDVEYQSRYGSSPATGYYLSAFDAANLLLDAVERTAVRDPDGSLHMGREGLRKALYATRGFKGVTGNLTCDEFGDCGVPVFNVLRLDDPEAGLEGLQSNILFTYSPGV